MRNISMVSGIVFGAFMLVPMSGWSQSSSQTPGSSGAAASQPGSADPSTRGSSSTDTSTRAGSMGSSSVGSSSAARGQWSREDVKSVQEALMGKGHNPGPIDGVMGRQTQQALREFQRAQNIQQSGQLDSNTANALGVHLSSNMGAGSSTTGSGSALGTGSSNRGSSTGTEPSSSGSLDSGSPAGSGTSTRGSSSSGTGSGTGSAPNSSGSSVNK